MPTQIVHDWSTGELVITEIQVDEMQTDETAPEEATEE